MLAAAGALVWFRSSIQGAGVLSSEEAQKERPPPAGSDGLSSQPRERAAAKDMQNIAQSDFDSMAQL